MKFFGSVILFGCLTARVVAGSDSALGADPVVAQPLPLAEVRLLDGPFRDAMLRDQNYLLSLDPERLLRNFRINAGLPVAPEIKPYGGWEAPDCELRGHAVGHYLSACSLMYASTGDERFKQRADAIVAGFAECQEALNKKCTHPGYLSAFPESFIDRVEHCQHVWAPWYTLHKILAGLIDANQLTGNPQALVVATHFADWVQSRVDHLPAAQMQASLGNEHGGMNEALANLDALTSNPDHLRLARAFNHHRVLDPLAQGHDPLDRLHANTQIPKIIGVARQYELTAEPTDATIARFFWDRVALHRSYVIGDHSDREYFFPVTDFAQHLTAETCETCNMYNLLKLTRHLFGWEPSATYMDFYERGLYNDILASQDPDDGMFVYLMSLKPGHFKTYSTPEYSFWCCVGTGMENHAKYGDTIYFTDKSAATLWVNLFIASELTWHEKGLVVRQETRFPEADATRLKFETQQPVQLALKIRWPAWASQFTVKVNGHQQKIAGAPGSYVTLDRTWNDGDHVDVKMPFRLHTEPLPGTSNYVAILDGPIVLAGRLGTNGIPDQHAQHQRDLVKVADPVVPTLAASSETVLQHIKPTHPPLTFRLHDRHLPEEVTLEPFYQAAHDRYTVYWQVSNLSSVTPTPATAH